MPSYTFESQFQHVFLSTQRDTYISFPLTSEDYSWRYKNMSIV